MKKLFLTVAAAYSIMPALPAFSISAVPGNTSWSIYVDDQNRVWSYVEGDENDPARPGIDVLFLGLGSHKTACLAEHKLLLNGLSLYAVFPINRRKRRFSFPGPGE